MNQHSSLWQKLLLAATTVLAWAALQGVAWAEVEVTVIDGTGGGGGKGAWVVAYALVILCVGLGMLTVCKSARLRERAKGEKYESKGLADMIVSKHEVPVISVGTRLDEVIKKLGKPIISRRGDDIYRELAAAGQLSEDDAAKEYMTFEHRAGRYELVVLDKRVVQVKSQPQADAG